MQRSLLAISTMSRFVGAVNARAVLVFVLLLLLVGCTGADEPVAPGADAAFRYDVTPREPTGGIHPQVPPPGAEEHEVNRYLGWLLLKESQGQGLSYFMLPDDGDFAAIPQDPSNPLNAFKYTLGSYLFFEIGMAVDNVAPSGFQSYSCGSCHTIQGSFFSNRPQGIGEGGSGFGMAGEARVIDPAYDYSPDVPDVTDLKPPTVLNCAYQEVMMWDGKLGGTGPNIGTEAQWTGVSAANSLGMHGVETQALAAMGVHRLDVDSLPTDIEYQGHFFLAFPPSGAPIDSINTAKGIAAFERSLLTNKSPFQKWLRGDNQAMTYGEKRGAILFFGKAGCVSCHTGPALNSMSFHAVGFRDLDGCWDPGSVDLTRFGGTIDPNVRKGRGGFTQNPADDYKFKTPQLYNLKYQSFFGHGSSFSSVRDVIEYKNRADKQNPLVPDGQLAAEFQPLGLNEREIDLLVTFIEDALYDPYILIHNPNHTPIGECSPNGDPQSRIDLGCVPALTFGPVKAPNLPPSRRQIAR